MKKVITVFVLDNEGLENVMDSMGNHEKNPMLHSLVTVDEDHPEIGNKLLTAGDDDVFHAEDMVKAIESYKTKPKEEEKKTPKKSSKKKKDDEGTYDTKVMTPSK